MKMNIPLLIVGLLMSYTIDAQTSEAELPRLSVGVGYFGELLTHGGWVVFGELSLNESQNQLLTRVNFINYRHKGHTKNFSLFPELVLRRNTAKGNYWEGAIGAGALYQKADSRIYEYEEERFDEKKSGWFYFMPSLGLRYGRTIQLSNGNLLTPNLGARAFYQYPFNDFWLFRTAVDLSISYQIK